MLSGAFSDAVIDQVSTEIDTAATLVSNRAVRGDDPNEINICDEICNNMDT